MRSISLLIMALACVPLTTLAETRDLDVSVSIYQNKMDLDYSGIIRDTRLTALEFAWVEKLAPSIFGSIELGYLEITQYSNPIPAGQTGSGDYLGLNLSFLMIDTSNFQLLTRLGYRYSEASHSIDGQSVDWDWHQGLIGLEGKLRFGQRLTMLVGASATGIDGRERAEGTLNQAQPFKAEEPLSGHIGLQLGLDPAGTIGIEITNGSLRGGRITFRRVF